MNSAIGDQSATSYRTTPLLSSVLEVLKSRHDINRIRQIQALVLKRKENAITEDQFVCHVRNLVGEELMNTAMRQLTAQRGGSYPKTIPLSSMLEFLKSRDDINRLRQIQALILKRKENAITDDQFVRLVSNLVGEELMNTAARLLSAQEAELQTVNQIGNQQPPESQWPLGLMETSTTSTPAQTEQNNNQWASRSITSSAAVSASKPPQKPAIGQKKTVEALGSSTAVSRSICSKRQKVPAAFWNRSVDDDGNILLELNLMAEQARQKQKGEAASGLHPMDGNDGQASAGTKNSSTGQNMHVRQTSFPMFGNSGCNSHSHIGMDFGTSRSYVKQQPHNLQKITQITHQQILTANQLGVPNQPCSTHKYPNNQVLQQTYRLQPPPSQRMESRAQCGDTQSQISKGFQDVPSTVSEEFVSISHSDSVRRDIDTNFVRTYIAEKEKFEGKLKEANENIAALMAKVTKLEKDLDSKKAESKKISEMNEKVQKLDEKVKVIDEILLVIKKAVFEDKERQEEELGHAAPQSKTQTLGGDDTLKKVSGASKPLTAPAPPQKDRTPKDGND